MHLELAFKYPPRLLHLADPYVFLPKLKNWGYQFNTNYGKISMFYLGPD